MVVYVLIETANDYDTNNQIIGIYRNLDKAKHDQFILQERSTFSNGYRTHHYTIDVEQVID